MGPLLQVDVFLTAQYFAVIGRGGHLEPEKRLMLAVLEDAIGCLRECSSSRDTGGRCLSHEAEEWMLEENKDWLFSFNNICEALGFDPDHMRKELLQSASLSGSRCRTFLISTRLPFTLPRMKPRPKIWFRKLVCGPFGFSRNLRLGRTPRRGC